MRGVLFDKDGTLIDHKSTWVPLYRTAATELADGDAEHAERMLLLTGYDPISDKCNPGTLLAVGTTDQLVSAWRPDMTGQLLDETIANVDRMFAEGASRNVVPITDLAHLFARLKNDGFALGIATNDGTRSAELCFQQLGLASELDFITGYDGVEQAKPAPDMAYAFCAACALEPKDIVVVGDNIHDLEMGMAAGAGCTIGVLSGNAAASDFAGQADAIVNSVADVPDELARRFATLHL